MQNYVLFFDTDCDFSPAVCAKYGAKLISMPYAINGEEIKPYVDFEEYDAKEFFGTLRKGIIPDTSALNVAEYLNYFEPVLKEGKDILYIHFSRIMSATFKSVDAAIKELLEKYPERRIELIDTKGITLSSYVLGNQMGELYLQGKSIDEIKAWAEENAPHQAFYFYADNLKFFAKSGRVSGFSAFMGGMIGIKPIIYINDEGQMTSIDKAVGRKKALEKLLQYVVDLEDHLKEHPVAIAHGDAMPLVDEFIKMLKGKFGEDLKVEVIDINPTAGSHCGADVIGVTFHAKHR